MNVGEALVARRAELGLSRAAAAKKAGIDVGTLRSAELNERWPQDVNRAKIEQALGWAPGSLEAIRDGGEPTELADDEPSQSGSILSGPSGPLPTGRSQPGASAFSESDQQRLLRGANAVGNALNNPADPANLSRIRASFRENIGRHGVTPDLVRTVAAGHLSDVVSQLDAPRRDQVVELAYRLLDEQEAESDCMKDPLDEALEVMSVIGTTPDGQVWERNRHGNWAAVRTIKMESTGVIWVGRRSGFMPADAVTSRYGEINVVDKEILRKLLREAGNREIVPETISAAILQSGISTSDDLAARRDSNTRGRPILEAVDDDDPTAGIDPARYAAHPRTEPLEEDNPTP